MCRVFETSPKQLTCILGLEVRQIDPGPTAGAALCNTSFGQHKSGINNKMDQSSFHCSWLALLALSKGCVPSCFHHMCDELTFSVSPTIDGLCSCQQAAVEVHLSSVGTKTASNQRRFRFQAILFDHTDRLRSFQDHTDLPMHMLMQNWQKLHFTRPQLKAILPLEDLCIFLCRSYCNVNLGMVEACAPLPAETRNCGAHRIKLKFPDWKSSLEIFYVESEAAWNRNPRRAEN